MSKIEKNYLQVPVNFLFMMDRHCFQLMAVLLQKYFYSKNTGKLSEDDTFLMSLTELDDVLNNANQKDTRLTIEALYRAGLIRVENYNGKRNITKFGINWKMVEDINNMIIQDLKDSNLYIQKLPRTERITYCSTNCIQNVYKLYTNCTPNINNIDNIYNINNKNNINNNLNINNNIIKEKENINSITTINIKEKEISEDLVNSVNNDEYVILNNFKEDMKGNFEELVTGLLQRMESKTREELREKRVKVIQWLNNHTDCYTPSERLEIEKKLEERYTELSESFVNPVNNDNILSSILLNGSAEPIHKKKENTTSTTSNTPTEPSNPFKASKEAISDTLTHQVEQIPTPSPDALKSPKKRLYGRSSDYCSNLEDLGYRSDEWKYECPVPLEVMNW